MADHRSRNQLYEMPILRLPSPNLKRVLLVSAAVWCVTVSVELILSEGGLTTKRAFEKATGGIAGAAFGILVAALVFDRLRARATREAHRRQEAEQAELTDFRRQLWSQEYSLSYEGLAGEVTAAIAELSRLLCNIFRIAPVRRALQRRGVGGSFLELEIADLDGLTTALSFSSSPTAEGMRPLQQVAIELAATAKQLEQIAENPLDTLDGVDIDLVSAMASDVASARSQVEACVDRIWASLRDMSSLHREMLDTRVPPPDLSMGVGLAQSIEMRSLVSDWRWNLGNSLKGSNETVFCAAVLASRARQLGEAGVELYSHVTGLAQYMEDTYIQGIDSRDRRDFLSSMARSNDQVVRSTVDSLVSGDSAGMTSILGEAPQSARQRTFLQVEEKDLVPEDYRDLM